MRANEIFNKEYIREFTDVNDGEGDDIEDLLKKLASQWWHGDESTQTRVEKTLEALGWEIGQDESGEPDAAVFLIMIGDLNGKSYLPFGKSELSNDLSEGWKDKLAAAALATGISLGSGSADANRGLPYQGYKEPIQVIQTVQYGDTVYSIARKYGVSPEDIARVNRLDRKFTIRPGDELAIPVVTSNIKNIERRASTGKIKTLSGTKHEALLIAAGKSAGMSKIELAAFLAQMAHETVGFKHLSELGGYRHFANYDPKYSPDLAGILGNTRYGDGMRYKGRGYIHLTGRDNYRRAGNILGLPLEKNPELAARPDIAAKIAIWYWDERVRPKVKNFNDVVQVTRPINPKLNGLDDRRKRFGEYKRWILAQK